METFNCAILESQMWCRQLLRKNNNTSTSPKKPLNMTTPTKHTKAIKLQQNIHPPVLRLRWSTRMLTMEWDRELSAFISVGAEARLVLPVGYRYGIRICERRQEYGNGFKQNPPDKRKKTRGSQIHIDWQQTNSHEQLANTSPTREFGTT